MIAKLTGIIDSIFENEIIIDVGGVGYLVGLSSKNIIKLSVGMNASFYIETVVRQDAITLFGFATTQEKNLFNLLTSVHGIGAKGAMSILSAVDVNEINNSILSGDHIPFTKANGIGAKTAERIVRELKDKIHKLNIAPSIKSFAGTITDDNIINDAISALINLGYSKNQVYPIVIKLAANNPMISTAELVKLGLKELNSF